MSDHHDRLREVQEKLDRVEAVAETLARIAQKHEATAKREALVGGSYDPFYD